MSLCPHQHIRACLAHITTKAIDVAARRTSVPRFTFIGRHLLEFGSKMAGITVRLTVGITSIRLD